MILLYSIYSNLRSTNDGKIPKGQLFKYMQHRMTKKKEKQIHWAVNMCYANQNISQEIIVISDMIWTWQNLKIVKKKKQLFYHSLPLSLWCTKWPSEAHCWTHWLRMIGIDDIVRAPLPALSIFVTTYNLLLIASSMVRNRYKITTEQLPFSANRLFDLWSVWTVTVWSCSSAYTFQSTVFKHWRLWMANGWLKHSMHETG